MEPRAVIINLFIWKSFLAKDFQKKKNDFQKTLIIFYCLHFTVALVTFLLANNLIPMLVIWQDFFATNYYLFIALIFQFLIQYISTLLYLFH